MASTEATIAPRVESAPVVARWRPAVARPSGVDQAESLVDRRDERITVGVLVQHVRAVEPCGGGGLDQQVRPTFVVRIGG